MLLFFLNIPMVLEIVTFHIQFAETPIGAEDIFSSTFIEPLVTIVDLSNFKEVVWHDLNSWIAIDLNVVF